MKPVESTSKILAYKVLDRDVDEQWIHWAVEMMMSGFDTESLVILAGISYPYNQFELQALTAKVFDELHLDYSDKIKVLRNYVCYLVNKILVLEIPVSKALGMIRDIYYELDYAEWLQEFYLLWCAQDDLLYSDDQLYWSGATRDNFESVVIDYCKNWKTSYCYS